jgi:hypothetical protein
MVAALKHNDRICRIQLLSLPGSQLEKILAAIQQPFPELTRLAIGLEESDTAPVAPDSFLGGSAPRLQEIRLVRIPFPGLPELLLSATHLVKLYLLQIPDSGYISPEAMVTCLSVLTSLEHLKIEFESAQSRPDPKGPPPLTRALLPALAVLNFQGDSEYLEDLVAWVDAPLLEYFHITFFHQLIFDTPRLKQFISRTPKFKAHDEACVDFYDWGVSVHFPQTFDGQLELEILCELLDLQLPSLLQVCSLSFPQAFIPSVEHLCIRILEGFTAVKDLYMSCRITTWVVPALQELVGERVTEVLPALQNIFLEEPLPSGPAWEAIEQFTSARQLAGHPIAVSRWEKRR